MNAPTSKPWNHESGVTCCDECNGAGVVPAARRATVSDPYPEIPCECERGPHEPECPVCGFGIEVGGFDCLVCDLVLELPDSALTEKQAQAIGAAVLQAMQARLAALQRAAA